MTSSLIHFSSPQETFTSMHHQSLSKVVLSSLVAKNFFLPVFSIACNLALRVAKNINANMQTEMEQNDEIRLQC